MIMARLAKVPSLAQDGMPEIVSLWRDEELLLGLNDLLLDRNGCGGPHFRTTYLNRVFYSSWLRELASSSCTYAFDEQWFRRHLPLACGGISNNFAPVSPL